MVDRHGKVPRAISLSPRIITRDIPSGQYLKNLDVQSVPRYSEISSDGTRVFERVAMRWDMRRGGDMDLVVMLCKTLYRFGYCFEY